jgi:hypothetical protein
MQPPSDATVPHAAQYAPGRLDRDSRSAHATVRVRMTCRRAPRTFS